MAEQVISPDINFVRDILKNGGESLKKCFQCATCSVVCNVTPDNNPFPRKEMMFAQWGLKDRLLSNPDIWLCHQCSDCTAYCPRGAKPGEVLGAIRKISIRNNSALKVFADMVGDAKYLLVLFAIPVIIFFLVIAAMGNFSNVPRGEDGGIVYSKFIPVPAIDIIFGAAAAFAVFSFALGIRKYWADMTRGLGGAMTANISLFESIKQMIIEVLVHRRFKKCDVAKGRATSHFLVFYSFAGLAITTTWALIYLYVFKRESPYPLSDPLKLLGNSSALALLVGVFLVIINRVKNSQKAGIGNYFDWLFITVIFVIMATGILSEMLRLANIGYLAYPVYFTHLVFVFFLFAYAPFSKMAHMVYRATAMVFAKYAEREVLLKNL